MDELFGIPTGQLTLVLLAIFGAGVLILAVLAVRDRTSFRMAVRNVPRRKTQTALIVVGLMLATLLFSAAFTTSDTLTNSLRSQALENIGRVDVVVKAKQPESGGGVPFGPGVGTAAAPEAREKYFDESLAHEIRDQLSGVESVAGVTALAKETVPATSPETNLSEPKVDVLGMDASSMKGFDPLKTASGTPLALEDLKENEVYVSQKTAEELGIGKGDKVEASLIRPTTQPKSNRPPSEPQSQQRFGTAQRPSGVPEAGKPPTKFEAGARAPGSTDEVRTAEPRGQERPPEFEVAGIYESGANPASDASMVMPLAHLQELTGEDGRINEVLVTHHGPAVEGDRYTTKTVDKLRPVLSANGLEADPVKKDAVEGADSR
jgi:putative ABC transport system permease protein